jgi:RNA polymerase sigma-70 factor (ECF subfamily)
MIKKEQEILQNVKNSDKKSFKKLFTNYHDNLFRFVFYKVKDSDIAEDITQETFLRVWKTREKIIPEKSFFSLIARISTNLCYDHFRHLEVRNRHRDQIPDFSKSHYDNPQSVTNVEILQEKIQDLVNKELPDKCKNIFILSRIEGKKNSEIAEILSLSIRTVENQIYRALKILKKHLKNYL